MLEGSYYGLETPAALRGLLGDKTLTSWTFQPYILEQRLQRFNKIANIVKEGYVPY